MSLALGHQVAAAQDRFTLGSPSLTVAEVQGRPAMVERLRSLGYEVWHFGESWVRVSYETDRVVGWWNADGALKVELRAGADVTRGTTFAAGSSGDDLVRLQGTPKGLTPYPETGISIWRYGPSTVRVALTDGRVVSWDDPVASCVRAVRRSTIYRVPPATPTSVGERLPCCLRAAFPRERQRPRPLQARHRSSRRRCGWKTTVATERSMVMSAPWSA